MRTATSPHRLRDVKLPVLSGVARIAADRGGSSAPKSNARCEFRRKPDVRRGDEDEFDRCRLRCDGGRGATLPIAGVAATTPDSSDVGHTALWAHNPWLIAAQAVGWWVRVVERYRGKGPGLSPGRRGGQRRKDL